MPDPANGDSLMLELLRKEQELLDDSVRADAARIRQILDDEFIEFTSSGRTYLHDAGATFSPTKGRVRIEPESVRVIDLSEEAKLVLFVSVSTIDEGVQFRTNRSSAWTLRDGTWKLAFHQGTRRPD